MMTNQKKEYFSEEDLRYLKVGISLALTSDDIREMPKTNDGGNPRIMTNRLHLTEEEVFDIFMPRQRWHLTSFTQS